MSQGRPCLPCPALSSMIFQRGSQSRITDPRFVADELRQASNARRSSVVHLPGAAPASARPRADTRRVSYTRIEGFARISGFSAHNTSTSIHTRLDGCGCRDCASTSAATNSTRKWQLPDRRPGWGSVPSGTGVVSARSNSIKSPSHVVDYEGFRVWDGVAPSAA
jgi:hypothetical protein